MKKLFFLLLLTIACVVSAHAAEALVNDSIYGFTTERASYRGGDAAMLKDLAEHLDLPSGVANDFSGRTMIKAVVEKNGTLSTMSIAKSCGRADVDSAVLKAAAYLSDYAPAKNDGEIVRSYTYIPASFPTVQQIMQQLAEIRAQEQEIVYLYAEEPRFTLSGIILSYTPTNKANATHFERIVQYEDTTRIQRVNLVTNKITDEDVLVKGTFTFNRIYEEGGGILTRTVKPQYETNEEVYMVAETMPQYPGGQAALFQFLSENVKYPVEAQKKGIQGRVICQFVVDKDGTISDVVVVRSGGDDSLDKEAVRVIKSMPRWIPGTNHGKRVRVKYTVPVNFRLE